MYSLRVLPILLFISYITTAQKIVGNAYYEKNLTLQIRKHKDAHAQKVYKNFMKAAQDANFVLTFTQDEAVFKHIEEMPVDDFPLATAKTIIGGGKGIYYINKKENIRLHQTDAYGNFFLIEGTFNELKWELLNTSKIIGDYTCYKARLNKKILNSKGEIKNRLVEAWYTPDIPVSFGPVGYGNLPGLIIQLTEGPATYTVRNIVFESPVTIKKPVKGEFISEMSFNLLAKRAIDNRNKMRNKRKQKNKS